MGTRKRIKLFFHRDMSEMWMYSFLMKSLVYIADDLYWTRKEMLCRYGV